MAIIRNITETSQIRFGTVATRPLLKYDSLTNNTLVVREGDDSDYGYLRCLGLALSANGTETQTFLEADESDFTEQSSIDTTMSGDILALTDLPRDLHLHFEDGAGATVTDSSGNGRDGTCTNMEDGDWVTGGSQKVGTYALQLGGTDEYVNFGDILNYDYTDNFVIEMWVYLAAGAAGVVTPLISKQKNNGSNGLIGWKLYKSGSDFLLFQARNDSGATAVYNSFSHSVALSTGAWKYIALMHTGNANSQNVAVQLYNGGTWETPVIGSTGGGLGNATMDSDADLLVGAVHLLAPLTGAAYYSLATFDELVVYPEAMSQITLGARQTAVSNSEVNYPMNTAGFYVTTNVNQIDTSLWENINSATFTESTPAGTTVRYAFSDDGGVTWYYYKNTGAWDTIAIGSLAAETTHGTKALYEALDSSDWASWFTPGTLDIAVGLKTTDLDATPTVTSIVFDHDHTSSEVYLSPKIYIGGDSTMPYLEAETTTLVNLKSGCVLTAEGPHGELYMDTPAAVTLDADATYEIIAGTTAAGDLQNFTHTSPGRLTYTGTLTKTFSVTATLTTITSVDAIILSGKLYKSGVAVDSTQVDLYVTTGANAMAWQLQGMIELATNDYIEIYAAVNDANPDVDLTVNRLTLTIY